MKSKKTYFLRTFYINEVLALISILLIVVQIPLKFIVSHFQYEPSDFLSKYSVILNRMIGQLVNTIDVMIILFVGTLLILVIPELFNRINKDSLINWFNSIWISFGLRKYLASKIVQEHEADNNLQCRNRLKRVCIANFKTHKYSHQRPTAILNPTSSVCK